MKPLEHFLAGVGLVCLPIIILAFIDDLTAKWRQLKEASPCL